MLISPELVLLIHSSAGLKLRLSRRKLIFMELLFVAIALVLSAGAAAALTPKSTKVKPN